MSEQMVPAHMINQGMRERPTVKPLTDWKKPPSLQTLKGDLSAAAPSHDSHVNKIRAWRDIRDGTGKAAPPKSKSKKKRSELQPKLVRRQNEWRYPMLSEPFLSSDKMFTVSPTSWEDVPAARQNETLVNWQFRTKIDTVKFIDDFVHSAVDEGTVIVRLGWFRRTEEEVVDVPIYTYLDATQIPGAVEQLNATMQLKSTDPHAYATTVPEELKASVDFTMEQGIPALAQPSGQTEQQKITKIIENYPTLDVLDYENVYIDPSCNGDITKAKFAVISFETSKADLTADGRYKNLDAVNWEGAAILAEPDHKTNTPSDFNFTDELRKRIVAYEYWGFHDIQGNGKLVPIVATWVGDVMIRLEENPYPDQQIPLVVAPYMPIKRALEGEPDAELLGDNQAILGAVMRGLIDLMGRSANAQQGFAKGWLDTTNKLRYEQGDDYEFNPGNGDPRLATFQHTYPEIPQSALTMLALQNQEAESISGVKAFSGGLSGEAYGDVAAGIRGMLDASSKREMAILRRLTNAMKKIAVKIIAMNGVFLADKEVVRVTNEEFVEISRDDLRGNFDMRCDLSTPEVDQAKAQDLGFMLQTIGPDMDPMLRNMVLADIARLKRMPDLAKRIENYKPQPDPMAEQLKQLELLKMQKEIEELDSKIQLNMAKAAAEGAATDQKNLDFLEQETGTKHERDLQRISTQAKSQGDTKILDALLNPPKEGEKAPNIPSALQFRNIAQHI